MYHGSISDELTSLLSNNFLFIAGGVCKCYSSTSQKEVDDKIQETLKFASHNEKHNQVHVSTINYPVGLSWTCKNKNICAQGTISPKLALVLTGP